MGIFNLKPRLSPGELADQLERLLSAGGWSEDYLRDELECVPIGDPALDAIRQELIALADTFARRGGHTYFAPEHHPIVGKRISELRAMQGARDSA